MANLESGEANSEPTYLISLNFSTVRRTNFKLLEGDEFEPKVRPSIVFVHRPLPEMKTANCMRAQRCTNGSSYAAVRGHNRTSTHTDGVG